MSIEAFDVTPTELLPVAVSERPERPAGGSLLSVPELAIDPAHYRVVEQGEIDEFVSHGEPIMIGSDKLYACSGLVLLDSANQKYTFAHLEPSGNNIVDYLGEHNIGWDQAVLVYGDLSEKQAALDQYLQQRLAATGGRFSLIRHDSGQHQWSLLLDCLRGDLTVLSSRLGQQTLKRYEALAALSLH